MEEANKLGFQVAIADMQRVREGTLNSMETIKEHCRWLISAASVVVAFFSTTTLVGSSNLLWWLPVSKSVIVGVLYLGMVAISLWVLSPVKMYGPIAAEWDEIQKAYIDKTERFVYEMQVSGLLNAIELNGNILKWRGRVVVVNVLLLGLITGLAAF